MAARVDVLPDVRSSLCGAAEAGCDAVGVLTVLAAGAPYVYVVWRVLLGGVLSGRRARFFLKPPNKHRRLSRDGLWEEQEGAAGFQVSRPRRPLCARVRVRVVWGTEAEVDAVSREGRVPRMRGRIARDPFVQSATPR